MSDLLASANFGNGSVLGPVTLYTFDPITFDGATRVCFEHVIHTTQDSNNFGPPATCEYHLYEDGVDLGIIAFHGIQSAQPAILPQWGYFFRTPAVGDHVYEIRAIGFSYAPSPPAVVGGYMQIVRRPVADDVVLVPRVTDFAASNPWLSSGALAFDGLTRVRIDGFCARVHWHDDVAIELHEDGVSLGEAGHLFCRDPAFGPGVMNMDLPTFCTRFLTPTAGTHTYTLEPQNIGDFVFYADPAEGYVPAFIRISVA